MDKNSKEVSTDDMGDLVLKELENEKFNLAVVGATGNVGREILNILDFEIFPIKELHAVASSRSEGMKISYGNDKEIIVQKLESFDFKKIDLVLSSPGSKVSEKFVPIAAKSGAFVIDNTSFRMKKDVPLVIPEVNPEDIKLAKNNLKSKLFYYPNDSGVETNT